MSDFGELSDERIRELVAADLRRLRDECVSVAERNERAAAEWSAHYMGESDTHRWAALHRRKAAHYQQAIDLLSAAPMPERSEA